MLETINNVRMNAIWCKPRAINFVLVCQNWTLSNVSFSLSSQMNVRILNNVCKKKHSVQDKHHKKEKIKTKKPSSSHHPLPRVYLHIPYDNEISHRNRTSHPSSTSFGW